MARPFKWAGITGLTVEALIFNPLGQVYDQVNNGMEVFNSLNYANYVHSVPEFDNSGVYVGDLINPDMTSISGDKFFIVYKNASGGSAVNNPVLTYEYRELLDDTEDFSFARLMKNAEGYTGVAFTMLRNLLSGYAEFGLFGPLNIQAIQAFEQIGAINGFNGDLNGNVTGGVGGPVASVTGNVGGNVVGTVAQVSGNVTGNVNGNVVGNVNGNLVGNVNGNLVGQAGSVVNVTGLNGFVLYNETQAISGGTTTSFYFTLTGVPLAVFRALMLTNGFSELAQQRRFRVRVAIAGGQSYWRNVTSITDPGGSTANITYAWTEPIGGTPTGSPVVVYENNVASLDNKRPFTIG